MRRRQGRRAAERLYREIGRELERAARSCACPSIGECAAADCPHCREELERGGDASAPACSVPGSPCLTRDAA